MVHFIVSSALATSLLLSSVAPGALAAPTRPLPLREGAQSGLMRSANAAVGKDHIDQSLAYSRRYYKSEPEHLLDVDVAVEANVLNKKEKKRGIWLNKSGVDVSSSGVLDADLAGLEIHLKRSETEHWSKRRAANAKLPRRYKHAKSRMHKRSEEEEELERRASKPKPKSKGKKTKSGKKGNKTVAVDGKKVEQPAHLVDFGLKASIGREKRSLQMRGLATAGVPGFVEVSSPLFNSTLARTIAGLVFTTNPDPSPNATSSFVLGTSESQSTQFYLTNAENPDPATPKELNVVNIRVPILDSQKFVSTDYCASFDLTPPSPLELLPCGDAEGYSQNFAYSGTTGELQPLYSSTPAPMALVSTSLPSNSTSSSNSTAPASPSNSTAPASASNSTQPAPNSFAATDSQEDSDAEASEVDQVMTSIGLYFIPASAYYDAPQLVHSLIQKADNETAADSTNSTEAATATPTALLPANATATATEMSSSSSSAEPSSTSTDLFSSSSVSSSSTSSSSSSPVPTAHSATTLRALASASSTADSASSSTPSPSPSSASLSESASPSSADSAAPSATVTVTETETQTASAATSSDMATGSETPLSTVTLPLSSSTPTEPASSSPTDSSSASSSSATPTVTLKAASSEKQQPDAPNMEQDEEKLVRRVRRFARW
ncbi:hypothetical protein JCM6882_004770 [Rhodosporidiobolus microsporus]